MSRNFNKPDYTYRVELDRVIDGDTIDVLVDVGFHTKMLKRLRFMEVDTEELRSSDPERKERAYEAKDYVITKLTEADKIYIQTVMDSTGKYGRLLAYVWFESKGEMFNLNDLLVSEGFQKL